MTRISHASQAVKSAEPSYEDRYEIERAIALDEEFRRFMTRYHADEEDFCEASREDRALLCERWEIEGGHDVRC